MEWTRGPILGRGSSATVSAAATTSGDVLAVKSAVLSQSESLRKEQYFLSILNSPYVVSYKGCDITKEENNMVYNVFMDYMSDGSLTDVISRLNGLGELEIARYTRQIVRGLEYIHANGIVHCDIKGRNVLLKDGGVKIGDFGCAKWANQASPICGTPMFMAPEVARGEEQEFPADVWAVGCTVIEMVTGNSPWSNVHEPVLVLYKIAFSGEIPGIPCSISDQGKDFLSKCLIRDPRKRWTAKELLSHPYIQQSDTIPTQISCEKARTNSPTSILDQDVWNSVGESPSTWSVSGEFGESDCSKNSLRQRIKQLAGRSEMANWRSEKGESEWVTIRINGGATEKQGRGGGGGQVAVGEWWGRL